MATKLKNMRLTSVDLVRNGANQEADICLFKSADPEEDPVQPTTEEKNIFKRFINWMRENHADDPQDDEETVEKDYSTFNSLNAARESNEKLWQYTNALTESIRSIQMDQDLSKDQKYQLMVESLDQFDAAMDDLIEILSGTTPPGGLAKSEPEEEEVEKFNPNHDSTGRFASSGGSGGGGTGASGAKAKLKGDMKAALSNLERATFEEGYGHEKKEATSAWNKLYAEDMDLGNEVLDEAGIERTKTNGWKWPEKLGKSFDIDEIEEV